MDIPKTDAVFVEASGLARIRTELKWLLRYQGLRPTLVTCAMRVLAMAGVDKSRSAGYLRYKASRFDHLFGLDTAEVVPVEQLDYDTAHSFEYDPTPSTEFGLVLSALRVDLRPYVFIDIGSGKGRVLLMASEFPFARVVGVELSAALHAVAEQNIATYRAHGRGLGVIESICLDAMNFEFPPDPLVLYLFNPFDVSFIGQMLRRLRDSLRRKPRDVIIIYRNPKYRHLFEESGFLVEVGPKQRRLWAIYRCEPGLSGSEQAHMSDTHSLDSCIDKTTSDPANTFKSQN